MENPKALTIKLEGRLDTTTAPSWRKRSDLAYAGAGIFSLYIGYDMYRAQSVRKTIDNAVDSAVDIYVDIVVLFTYVLEIVGNRN